MGCNWVIGSTSKSVELASVLACLINVEVLDRQYHVVGILANFILESQCDYFKVIIPQHLHLAERSVNVSNIFICIR